MTPSVQAPAFPPADVAASSSLSALLARLESLDAKIRSIDASWSGVSGGLVSASAAPDAFGAQLAALGLATFGSSGVTGAGAAPAPASTPRAAATMGQTFGQPVVDATVTQPYGPTSLSLEPPATVDGVSYAHFHDGIDLAAPLGTPVRAATDGTVTSAGRTADGAVVVCIRHDDGSETRYGHLEPSLSVKTGDRVTAGESIGTVGVTGNTTGPHLHFELWYGGRTIDPAPWLARGVLPGATASPTVVAGGPGDSGRLTPQSLDRFDALAASIPFASDIRAAAVSAGIDPLLLASLVSAESGFRANAVSSAGAQGLTQLMPATARSLGVTDPFDAAENLAGGARYLASDLRLYGRTDLALAAYQAGKGAVAAAGGIPDYPSTRSYIATVLASWTRYLGRSA